MCVCIHVTECYLTAQFITCAVHAQHTGTCTHTYYSHRRTCKTFWWQGSGSGCHAVVLPFNMNTLACARMSHRNAFQRHWDLCGGVGSLGGAQGLSPLAVASAVLDLCVQECAHIISCQVS